MICKYHFSRAGCAHIDTSISYHISRTNSTLILDIFVPIPPEKSVQKDTVQIFSNVSKNQQHVRYYYKVE